MSYCKLRDSRNMKRIVLYPCIEFAETGDNGNAGLVVNSVQSIIHCESKNVLA
jgi:hypothetical protein